MKHAIQSVEFLLQMKGFRHGANRQPIDPAHEDSKEYCQGYKDGVVASGIYADCLCKKLGLENSKVTVS